MSNPTFRMPAEWEPHAATWIAWPHEHSDWPGKFEPIPHLYCEIVRILSRRETVLILTPPQLTAQVKSLLKQAHAWNANVRLVEAKTNRSWARDYCPTVVRSGDGKRRAVKWQFNGWAKYPNSEGDDAAGELAAGVAKLPIDHPDWNGRRVVLEGGSIDVNGAGAILTTEECLLSRVQQRNPGVSREQYEALFDGWLGAGQTIWLNKGITGDDTHGHVDDLARFVGEDTVVTVVEEDRSDKNYDPLQENLERLRVVRIGRKKLKVIPLPMPRPVRFNGQRLPASYANFYLANGVVLVPQFQDSQDRIALNTLKQCFPDRDVIGIYCVDLVLGLGTLHCMTMQLPR